MVVDAQVRTPFSRSGGSKHLLSLTGGISDRRCTDVPGGSRGENAYRPTTLGRPLGPLLPLHHPLRRRRVRLALDPRAGEAAERAPIANPVFDLRAGQDVERRQDQGLNRTSGPHPAACARQSRETALLRFRAGSGRDGQESGVPRNRLAAGRPVRHADCPCLTPGRGRRQRVLGTWRN